MALLPRSRKGRIYLNDLSKNIELSRDRGSLVLADTVKFQESGIVTGQPHRNSAIEQILRRVGGYGSVPVTELVAPEDPLSRLSVIHQVDSNRFPLVIVRIQALDPEWRIVMLSQKRPEESCGCLVGARNEDCRSIE